MLSFPAYSLKSAKQTRTWEEDWNKWLSFSIIVDRPVRFRSFHDPDKLALRFNIYILNNAQ